MRRGPGSKFGRTERSSRWTKTGQLAPSVVARRKDQRCELALRSPWALSDTGERWWRPPPSSGRGGALSCQAGRGLDSPRGAGYGVLQLPSVCCFPCLSAHASCTLIAADASGMPCKQSCLIRLCVTRAQYHAGPQQVLQKCQRRCEETKMPELNQAVALKLSEPRAPDSRGSSEPWDCGRLPVC